jgi:uncharacterized protein involved in response to NO
MKQTQRKIYTGPTLFSYGFRPFFLIAIMFGLIIIPLWIAVYLGHLELNSVFPALDWHIHEMLFGYAGAVISGFLFTAIPNWTGRMPIKGWPLMLLLGIWVIGRLAMAGIFGFGPLLVMVTDCVFLAAICLMITTEVIAGRNWRNLKVIIPIVLFLCANIVFHTEVMMHGSADLGRRLGIAVVVFLITLIGGRIIPSFTRNWLVKTNPGPLPVAFNRFDAVCLLSGVAALIGWVALPDTQVTGGLLIAASALHMLRLSRWQGVRTVASPLLLILHVAYAFIPIGLFTLGIRASTAGLHLLGIGAIVGMTIAVIIRATLGHTGRPLQIGHSVIWAFALLMIAAILRSFSDTLQIFGLTGLNISVGLWVVGFSIVLIRIGPMLWSKRVEQRTPNKQP